MTKAPAFLLLSFFAFFSLNGIYAQDFAPVDKSPADICLYNIKDTPQVKIVYSRPQLKSRQVFGKLVPYGKVWRTGANEATTIKFYKEVILGGRSIPAGEYSLFSIPGPEQWTIILNSQADQWGAYSYDDKKDVVRFNVPARKTTKAIEIFSILMKESPDGVAVTMGWENTLVEFPVKFK